MKIYLLLKKLPFFRLAFFVALVFIATPGYLDAGFGISPPYVQNSELTRNSVYEQRVMLSRGNPEFDLVASVEVNVPGADEWITIEPGEEVFLPKGERQVPIVVKILIPNKADFGDYSGSIRVRTQPADGERKGGGAVSIALGARINVNLSVIDRVIREFDISSVKILDFNEGRRFWWLEYPGKMRFRMVLRNTGNVPVSPDRVTVDIYDSTNKKLLEKTEHTNRIKKVNPFKTDEIFAELPSHLPPGSYRGHIVIYNGEKEVRKDELSFNIRPAGTIAGDTGYGFMGLSLWHKFTIVGPITFFLSIFLFIVFYFSKKARRFFFVSIFSLRKIYTFPIRIMKSFLRLILGGFSKRRLSRD